DYAWNAFEFQRSGGLFATRAGAEIKSSDDDVAFLIKRVEIWIVIFKRNCRHLLGRPVVAVSVFAGINAVSVQIVFVDEKNATSHARRKAFHDLTRSRWPCFPFRSPDGSARRTFIEIRRRADESSQSTGCHHSRGCEINK